MDKARIRAVLLAGALLAIPALVYAASNLQSGSNCKSTKRCIVIALPSPSPSPSPTPSPTPTPTVSFPASSGSVTWDDSVGAGVDAAGFANLPLRAGARRLFVNSASGSDAAGCAGAVSPATPLKSIVAARDCITILAGAGDQIMIAEGTSYAEGLPNFDRRFGYSPVYPTAIQSYDPADPLNEARHGRATGARRPKVNTAGNDQSILCCSVEGANNLAIRGLDIDPGDKPGMGMSFVGQSSHVLIENNIFRYTTLSFDRYNSPRSAKHIIRKNAFFGSWSPTAHAQGIYDSGTDALTIEDNVFWHNGWRIGASRDDDPGLGGPTMFRHSVYTQTDTSALVRRNVFLDPAATGASVRGDITLSENVFIDNPMAVFAGIGNDYNVVRPNGVQIDIGYNLILGDADLNAANPRGMAISTANGKPGSSTHHNLILRSRDPGGVNTLTFNNQAIYNQPSYMSFDSNLVYRFSAVIAGTGGPYPAQVFSTYANNVWDAAPSATNTSSTGVAFPNPITSAELYTVLGCATKQACATQMVQSPELAWASQIRSILWQGYLSP